LPQKLKKIVMLFPGNVSQQIVSRSIAETCGFVGAAPSRLASQLRNQLATLVFFEDPFSVKTVFCQRSVLPPA
jgi:hypothetical protein